MQHDVASCYCHLRYGDDELVILSAQWLIGTYLVRPLAVVLVHSASLRSQRHGRHASGLTR